MIHPAHQGDVQISDVDNAALCKEISERLVNSLGPKPFEMPPHLMVLMRQLRDEPPKPVINLPSKS
jgi:hypothetical protein